MENPYQSNSVSGAMTTNDRKPRSFTQRIVEILVVAAILLVLVGLLLPSVRTASGAARRMSCSNNFKQLSLALLNYENTYGVFPPAYTVDESGKRLHSWRTLILPYLEQQALYDSIDLTKAWDDLANAGARENAITTFRCPQSETTAPSMTCYFALAGEDAFLLPTGFRELASISDGAANTVMLWEGTEEMSIHWMDPSDPGKEHFIGSAIESSHGNGANVAFGSGQVHWLATSLSPQQRRSLVSIAGGERIQHLK